MDDEIRVFADGRPAAPPYSHEARERARDRLLREARGRGGLRRPRLGWQAVAAFGITVALVGGVAVALTGEGRSPDAATSVTRAGVSIPELDPKPGQFILVESDTMYGAHSIGRNGETRHLYRTHRKIWQPVDGTGDGLLLIESREPKPYPGEKDLPKDAGDGRGSDWIRLAFCPQLTEMERKPFTYLRTLPTEPAAMRETLYRGQPQPATGEESDRRAFTDAADLLRERYLPRAQRDALYEAVKSIDGVTEAEGVEDSVGRRGVALGRTDAQQGVREEIIFDPETRMMLGERATVVDEKVAKAPQGSLVAHTAQLKVSVVDAPPEPPAGTPRGDCMPSPSDAPPTQATDPSDAPASAQPSAPLSDAPDAPRPADAPTDGPTRASDGPGPSAPASEATDGPAPTGAPSSAPAS